MSIESQRRKAFARGFMCASLWIGGTIAVAWFYAWVNVTAKHRPSFGALFWSTLLLFFMEAVVIALGVAVWHDTRKESKGW